MSDEQNEQEQEEDKILSYVSIAFALGILVGGLFVMVIVV